MKKVIYLLLAVVMLFSTMGFAPLSMAETDNGANTSYVKEVEELRETNSNTYLLSDGSYECVVYAEDRYYKDSKGKLIEIDNSIISTNYSGKFDNYEYKNASGNMLSYFSANAPSILVEAEGESVSFRLNDARKTKPVQGGDSKYQSLFGYQLSGESSIVYRNALPATDLVYTSENNMLKEFIVLKNIEAPKKLRFKLETNGLLARAAENGTVELISKSGKKAFELSSLFAVDGAGVYTDEINYSIISANYNSAEIEISISDKYVNNPQRVFPIMIDPSITVSGSSKTYDSFVASSKPSLTYDTSESLCTGKSTTYGIRRSYIKFNLPENVPIDSITSAYINIKKKNGEDPSVKAYRVTGPWESDTLKWNNKPSSATNASGTASPVSNGWYKINLTNLTKKWLKGTCNNYGVMLRGTDETDTSKWTSFYSSDASQSNVPQLVINYNGTSWYVHLCLGVRSSDEYADQVAYAVSNAFSQNGYTGVTYRHEAHPNNSVDKETFINELKSKKVFCCLTHGEPNGIHLPKGKFLGISDLPASMSNLRFVYLGACLTGQGGAGADNFVNALYARGVGAVLGFTVTIKNGEADYWSKYFMVKIAAGGSIKQAKKYANSNTIEDLGVDNIRELSVCYQYMCGSEDFVPCPHN